jgi:hypothetical protein
MDHQDHQDYRPCRDGPIYTYYRHEKEWKEESDNSGETLIAFRIALGRLTYQTLIKQHPHDRVLKWVEKCKEECCPPLNQDGIPYDMMDVGWFPSDAEVGIIDRSDPYSAYHHEIERRRRASILIGEMEAERKKQEERDVDSRSESSLSRKLSNSWNSWFRRGKKDEYEQQGEGRYEL